MVRVFLLFAMVLAAHPGSVRPALAQDTDLAVPVHDVHLRNPLTVEGVQISLGDLFDDAGVAADVPVAMAPAPGKRLGLDANQIVRLAADHGLRWGNPRGLRRILVTRASQTVPGSQITQALADALGPEFGEQSLEVRTNGRLGTFHAALDVLPTIGIDLLDVDPANGRFRARIRVPETAQPEAGRIVTGRVHPLTPVPVLARTLSVGHLIGRGDWEWQDMRVDRLPRNAVIDPGRLAGMALRRTLRVGSVIKETDVATPAMVERGDLVTVTVRRPGMELTAMVRALEDGALHDVIRFRNTTSMRIIEGRVSGPGRADALTATIRTASR